MGAGRCGLVQESWRTREYGYCEDYPACGHTDQDPCPGRGPQAMTAEEAAEAYYCDRCGYSHLGPCPDDYDYDDGLADALNREAEEESLGRPLFPNEY